MGANNEDTKPLLHSTDKVPYAVEYAGDQSADEAQIAALVSAAKENHRRQRRRRIGHAVFAAVVFILLSMGFLARHTRITFTKTGAPLDGPLELPINQCRTHGETNRHPASTFPIVFGNLDEHPTFAVRQNSTRHHRHTPPEGAENGVWRSVQVSGDVVYRRAGPNQEPSVVVEAVDNDDRILYHVAYDKDRQILDVTIDDLIWVERGVDDDFKDQACAVVRITVWVPEGERLPGQFHTAEVLTRTVHLGIKLIDDLDLVLNETLHLRSVAGSIDTGVSLTGHRCASKMHGLSQSSVAAYLVDAPEISAQTVSGHISGPWPLFNRLVLSSVSGHIGVKVLPQDSDFRETHTSALEIHSVSGKIDFVEGPQASRSHGIVATTKSGAINGKGSFSGWAIFESVSGRIDVALTPVLSADEDAKHTYKLNTKTVSGSTKVELADPVVQTEGGDEGSPLDWLVSNHESVSGSIKLHYPGSWVGHVLLKTVASGRLSIKGKDVQVVPDKRPHWPPAIAKKLEAVKGNVSDDEGSQVTAVSTSSSISLVFP